LRSSGSRSAWMPPLGGSAKDFGGSIFNIGILSVYALKCKGKVSAE
jgi:hypothetical protein